MNPANPSWDQQIQGIREGDSRCITAFWQEYGPLLERVAESHLGKNLRRRLGPEDVARSACRTFMRRAAEGQFQIEDSDSLWSLLCAITLTKAREKARYHQRQKRGLDREVALSPTDDSLGGAYEPVSAEPTPEQVAEYGEHLESFLAVLDSEERQIVESKLENYTHQEIAQQLGTSERTVRRLFKRAQAKLSRMLEESMTG